jgi:hypothetical protein
MIKKFKLKISSLIFLEDGGKKIINKKRFSVAAIVISIIVIVCQIISPLYKSQIPPGGITKSDSSLIKDNSKASLSLASTKSNQNMGGVVDALPKKKAMLVSNHRMKAIRYKGKQVIGPDAITQRIPSGANFVGKLLTSIDTRSQQRVHVILPFGGSHKSGGGNLPPETILMGQFNYPGQGERVFIIFTKAIFPDGQEIAIQAQALSSKDYRSGIIGDYHSNKGSQMASVLGLSMISGVSEVMVEKQGLGQTFNATPKPTLKNGIYNGVAKVTETEANDQATQLAQAPKYVTIDSGSDVIISLGESFGTNE